MSPDSYNNNSGRQMGWRFVLIALLFVLQQAVLAAHPYEHDIDSDHSDCHVCVVTKSSAGLPAVSIEFTVPAFPIAYETRHDSFYLPVITHRGSIRAPPLTFS